MELSEICRKKCPDWNNAHKCANNKNCPAEDDWKEELKKRKEKEK
jgi:hypothetical protein